MLLNGCPKKKCVTMPLANTAPYTSARIIISYYSSTQKKSYKYVQRLYLKHGRIDVQVSEGKCSSYVAGYVNSSVFSPTLSLHILRDKEKFIIRELGRASTALPSWMAPPNALRAKRKPQTQRSKRSERSDAELSTDFFIIIFYVSPPMFNLKIFVLWELLQ